MKKHKEIKHPFGGVFIMLKGGNVITEKEISEHYAKHLKVLESAIERDVAELSKQIMETIYRLGVSCSLFPF